MSPRLTRHAMSTDRAEVPAFFLYGEPLRAPDGRTVHVETIAARSSRSYLDEGSWDKLLPLIKSGDIVRLHGETRGVRGDPRVPGRADDLGPRRGGRERPHERVLPAAGSYHEDSAWECFRFQRTWSFFL